MKALHRHTTRTALSLGAVTALVAMSGAPALADSGNKNDKQTICHATSSDTNPYVMITPNKNADVQGHDRHSEAGVWTPTMKAAGQRWGDIIPPFTYNDHGETKSYPGMNWAAGQAWFDNDCQVPITGTVVKTNDANADGTFTDDETADAVGESVTFRVVVTNTSAVPVVIGSFTDAVGGTPITVTPTPDVVGDTLAAGSSVTVTFTVPAYTPADGVSTTNLVTVELEQVGNGGNGSVLTDTSTVRTVVPREVSIVKTGPASVAPGDTFSWTLSVRNDSDGVAVSDVVVTDTLPTGTTLVTAGGSDWTMAGTTDLTFTHVGDLAAGATSTITITVSLDAGYTADTVVNTAVVTPTDTTPENNTSTVTTPVTGGGGGTVTPPGGGGGGTVTPPGGGGGGTVTPPGGGGDFTGGGGVTGPAAGGGGGGGTTLPLTGDPLGALALLALALLATGSGIVLLSRKHA